MPGLSHALVPAQESKRWSFGRLLLLPVTQKVYFWARKSQEKLDTPGLPSNALVWCSIDVFFPCLVLEGTYCRADEPSLLQHSLL